MVTVKASKTNTNRLFAIVDDEQENLMKLIRKYVSLRPKHVTHKRFFILYRNNKCSAQPVGVNTFAKMPYNIAKFLQLNQPHLYTGHCFRRSSASILSDHGADFSAIKRLGGWKSTAVAEGYIENSLQNKIHTAEKIFCNKAHTSTSTSQLSMSNNEPSTSHNCTSTEVQSNSINIQDENMNINLFSNQVSNETSVPAIYFNNCTITNINLNHAVRQKGDNSN